MSNALAQQWLTGMVGVSLQFTVFVGIVAAVLFLLRPLPPRARYVVWLVVLVRLAVPVGVTSTFGTMPSSLTRPPMTDVPVLPRSPATEPAEMTEPAREVTQTPASSGAMVSTPEILFVTWAVGVLGLVTIHLVRAAQRRRRIVAARESLPDRLSEHLEALRIAVGLRRAPEAWAVRDDALRGPSIQGFVRPRILLPTSLVQSWRRDELEPVVLHELIHLKRWDPVARALGNAVRIVYFFHPLVWWVTQRLHEERERACDDAVVRQLRGGKRAYLRSLLRLVEEGSAGFAPVLSMATTRRPLAKRLKRMLRPDYDPSARTGVFAPNCPLSSLSGWD